MTPQQKKQHAERILKDEVLQDAFSVIEEEAIGVFKYPNASEEEVMEARGMVLALGALRRKLDAFIADGLIAERRNK